MRRDMQGMLHRHCGYSSLLLLFLLGLSALPGIRAVLSTELLLFSAYWLTLLFLLYAVLPRAGISVRGGLRRSLRLYAFSGAGLYLAIRYTAGVVMKKLAATPYDHSLPGILRNILELMLPILVREGIRAHALGSIRRSVRYRAIRIGLLTLFLALLTLYHPAKLGQLRSGRELFIYLASDAATELSLQALLTVLAQCGGAGAAVCYAGTVSLFQRLFPFLPELPWLGEASIGICFPVLYALFVREQYRLGEEGGREVSGISISYLLGLFAAIGFYWFCIGVFPLYPSVVLTGSMEPGIRPGDVVIVRRITEEREIYQLEEGEILNFQQKEINITHRILKIREDEAGNRSFVTKGDNNASEDTQPVQPNDVNGTVVRILPKAGIPVLLLHSGGEIPAGVVDPPAQRQELSEP